MYIQCIKLTNSSNRSPGDPGDEIRFNRHLGGFCKFQMICSFCYNVTTQDSYDKDENSNPSGHILSQQHVI